MDMYQLTWLIPFFPLLGFVLTGALNKKLSPGLSSGIASIAVLCSFIISVVLFFSVSAEGSIPERIVMFDWITAGDLQIPFSFLIDRLSIIMLLVVTGVGFLIHLYSAGYMHHDPDHARFFSYLNLFIFFMLLLVMGANYIVMFAGWEGVGLCSYLLIGFWFKNQGYNRAANKAFIMNRIGDLGFLLGVFLIYMTFGSVQFQQVFASAKNFPADTAAITAITLLLFIGAMGKSAQIPLYTWLPDAMAGPTPVSALIHAATMVTAGIYMVIRSNILYSLAPYTMEIVAFIGLLTAIFAATIGLKQHDIKKVLAYSTVSQLGYMFVALGVGAYDTALFHVVMHAFFKALLFLGAGSVIHAMSGEQDIRKMGGLKKALPVTHITFLAGTLAIAGVFPFAGFFSKDEILAETLLHSPLMFSVLMITSALTAVYMFRLYWLTFHGEFRGTEEQRSHLHESPASMTIPLIILAVLSTVGGFLGMPHVFHVPHLFNEFLDPVIIRGSDSHLSVSTEYMVMGGSLLMVLIIIFFTYNYYVKQHKRPETDESELTGIERVLNNKYYVDEIYSRLITKPLDYLSYFTYRFIETGFIDRIVNGAGSGLRNISGVLRLTQTGNIGSYIFGMVIGVILLLFLTLIM